LLAELATMDALSACDPSAPETHVALAGALRSMRRTLDEVGHKMEAVQTPAYVAANWRVCLG
jgi:hypothetical protein